MQRPLKIALTLALVTSITTLSLFFMQGISSDSNDGNKGTKDLVAASDISNASPFITFADSHLMKGREIWLENCKGCHGYGTAGAPIPTESNEWDFRIAKGMPTLYAHAINGFFGPDDTMMPERGGNPDLSDEQVKAAVDYTVALASHYINSVKENK